MELNYTFMTLHFPPIETPWVTSGALTLHFGCGSVY